MERDKKKHIAAGWLAGFTGGWFGFVLHIGWWGLLTAFMLAGIVGVLKEWRDRKITGFDKTDLLATVGGGAVAVIVWMGIILLNILRLNN